MMAALYIYIVALIILPSFVDSTTDLSDMMVQMLDEDLNEEEGSQAYRQLQEDIGMILSQSYVSIGRNTRKRREVSNDSIRKSLMLDHQHSYTMLLFDEAWVQRNMEFASHHGIKTTVSELVFALNSTKLHEEENFISQTAYNRIAMAICRKKNQHHCKFGVSYEEFRGVLLGTIMANDMRKQWFIDAGWFVGSSCYFDCIMFSARLLTSVSPPCVGGMKSFNYEYFGETFYKYSNGQIMKKSFDGQPPNGFLNDAQIREHKDDIILYCSHHSLLEKCSAMCYGAYLHPDMLRLPYLKDMSDYCDIFRSCLDEKSTLWMDYVIKKRSNRTEIAKKSLETSKMIANCYHQCTERLSFRFIKEYEDTSNQGYTSFAVRAVTIRQLQSSYGQCIENCQYSCKRQDINLVCNTGEIKKWLTNGTYGYDVVPETDSIEKSCTANQNEKFVESCLEVLRNMTENFVTINLYIEEPTVIRKKAARFCERKQVLRTCHVRNVAANSCVKAENKALSLVKFSKRLGILMDYEGFGRFWGNLACSLSDADMESLL